MEPLTESYWPADPSRPVLETTTGDLLRQAAADAGDQLALIEVAPPGAPSLTGADRSDRRWTYRQLLDDAEQCAHWLLGRFSPGERITVTVLRGNRKIDLQVTLQELPRQQR